MVLGCSEPPVAKFVHDAPVVEYEACENRRDDIYSTNMCPKADALNILDGHCSQNVVADWFYGEVVREIEGNEDAASDEGCKCEEPPHEAHKTQESNSIQANFVDKF